MSLSSFLLGGSIKAKEALTGLVVFIPPTIAIQTYDKLRPFGLFRGIIRLNGTPPFFFMSNVDDRGKIV